MKWLDYYNRRKISSAEAISHIHSNNRVVIGHACGEPSLLVEELANHADFYHNVEIVHMVAMGTCPYVRPGMEKHFRHNALFVGAPTREAIARGAGSYTPCFFFEIPRLFSTSLPVDVALVMITPPDENGLCSLGVSVDYTLAAIKNAKIIIKGCKSKNLPNTNGLTKLFDTH